MHTFVYTATDMNIYIYSEVIFPNFIYSNPILFIAQVRQLCMNLTGDECRENMSVLISAQEFWWSTCPISLNEYLSNDSLSNVF